MGFRINTNVSALNAHATSVANNRELSSSLEKLSTGLRINKAADDGSGLQIANTLRNQADSLGQAIRNSNDAVGILQIADKAMDEQVKIVNTIKVKATQSAQDGQTMETRKAIQEDITRLMEQLDNIASTTSYNGRALLSGQFTNQKFEVGAYSNQTINVTIGATSSDKIGNTRFETGTLITASGDVSLTFKAVDGVHDIKLENVKISTSVGTGIGALAEVINKNSDKTGIKASWQVIETASAAVQNASTAAIKSLTINGIKIGDILDIKANDSDGKLVASINSVREQTGVEASIDEQGRLNLRSLDGRGIKVEGNGLSIAGFSSGATQVENYGRLTLTRLDVRDIVVSGGSGAGFDSANVAEATINLRTIKGHFSADQASAIGAFANSNATNFGQQIGVGATTLRGAMAVMDIADSTMKYLDKIRSDVGAVQNQLVSTINNISVTQVNVKAAESQIRDVDFASETANFQKRNLLAQAGSYALSQANAAQQNVMRLLQ